MIMKQNSDMEPCYKATSGPLMTHFSSEPPPPPPLKFHNFLKYHHQLGLKGKPQLTLKPQHQSNNRGRHTGRESLDFFFFQMHKVPGLRLKSLSLNRSQGLLTLLRAVYTSHFSSGYRRSGVLAVGNSPPNTLCRDPIPPASHCLLNAGLAGS